MALVTKDGLTPLTPAAFNGSDEIVHLLLQHGTDVNRARGDGYTALAEAMGRNSTAEILRKAGAR
ncbi:MAG: ankyrin repeat domain-containing protein [Xanthomonadales bacterium]|nr:ankyrin repeat domain-containing protein [Xanthomonadales bacterium]